jgi:hypothetical protein
MAFIEALQTRRPSYRQLFKWVAIVFLLPLLALAIMPAVIVAVAQLPGIGQLIFSFLGGAIIASPFVVARRRYAAIVPTLGKIFDILNIIAGFGVNAYFWTTIFLNPYVHPIDFVFAFIAGYMGLPGALALIEFWVAWAFQPKRHPPEMKSQNL